MCILTWVHGRLLRAALGLLLLREIGEINRERRDLGHHLQPALARELAQEQVQSAALALEVMKSATLAKETDLAPAQVRATRTELSGARNLCSVRLGE